MAVKILAKTKKGDKVLRFANPPDYNRFLAKLKTETKIEPNLLHVGGYKRDFITLTSTTENVPEILVDRTVVFVDRGKPFNVKKQILSEAVTDDDAYGLELKESISGKYSAAKYAAYPPEKVLSIIAEAKGAKRVIAFEAIEWNTKKVVQQKAFLSISEELLVSILGSNRLSVAELELVKRVIAWGEAELKRRRRNDTSLTLQAVIDAPLRLCRLLILRPEEVACHVLPKGILDPEVAIAVMSYLTSPTPILPPALRGMNPRKRKPLRCLEFKWDHKCKHNNISVQKTTATSSGSNVTIALDPLISEGKARVEFKWANNNGYWMAGVIPDKEHSFSNSGGHIGDTSFGGCGIFTSGSWTKYRNNSSQGLSPSHSSSQGQIFGLEVDMTKRTLRAVAGRFSKPTRDFGVVWTNIPKKVRFAVTFYNSSLQILEPE